MTSSTPSATTSSGMARLVRDAVAEATEALLEGERRDRRAGDQRRRRRSTRSASSSRSTAFELLSLQQPVAGDLRTLVAALRMVGELERMGDLAVHVAKIARLRVPDGRRTRGRRADDPPDGRRSPS